MIKVNREGIVMMVLDEHDIQALDQEQARVPESASTVRQLIQALVALAQAGRPIRISVGEETPVLLTTAEVAQLMRVSERTVRDWCERGLVTAFQSGGSGGAWRIRAEQFAQRSGQAVEHLLDTVHQINMRFGDEPLQTYER